MSHFKVAVLGAGSVVSGPSLLKDAIAEHRLDGVDLALVDADADAAALMAAVGRRMASDLGVTCAVSAHAQPASALDGASFVIACAAGQPGQRFETDRAIIGRHCPEHTPSPCAGVAGISHSLRRIAQIERVCGEMRKAAPNAWLLLAGHRVSRLAQAAHETGTRTVGFCSASLNAYGLIWRILHGQSIGYPFEPARARLELTMGGVCGCSWVTAVRSAEDGTDLYPLLRQKAGELLEPIGWLPAGGHEGLEAPAAPTPEQRDQRMQRLREVADGRSPWSAVVEPGAWERPMDLVAAMTRGRTSSFPALDLVNCGQLPGLPGDTFVQTPAVGTSIGPIPQKVDLPATLLERCRPVAELNGVVVRAARQRSRRLLHQAVELDPTITDKPAGCAALDACLAAHSDVLPAYR